jgi:hypothetical protein
LFRHSEEKLRPRTRKFSTFVLKERDKLTESRNWNLRFLGSTQTSRGSRRRLRLLETSLTRQTLLISRDRKKSID